MAPDLPIDPEREIQREANRGRAAAALENGTTFARNGEIRAAVSKFAEARQIDVTFTIDFASWSLLCWRGTVSRSAGDVVDACENAVRAAPREEAFKAYVGRGLTRAMTGQTGGAVQDFRTYAQWEKENERNLGLSQVVEDWAMALEAGVDPFDAPTIEALRDLVD